MKNFEEIGVAYSLSRYLESCDSNAIKRKKERKKDVFVEMFFLESNFENVMYL